MDGILEGVSKGYGISGDGRQLGGRLVALLRRNWHSRGMVGRGFGRYRRKSRLSGACVYV